MCFSVDLLDCIKHRIGVCGRDAAAHTPEWIDVRASPEFWQLHGKGAAGLADVHESHFIHTNWGPNYASHPSWADWFAAAGGSRAPDPSHGRRVGLSSLAIGAARLGLGIALGQRVMASADLEAGRLIALSSVSVRLGQPYCAFMLPAKAERADIAGLVELLASNPAKPRTESASGAV